MFRSLKLAVLAAAVALGLGSPASAADRNSARPRGTSPHTVTSQEIFAVCERSPPANTTPYFPASFVNPARNPSTHCVAPAGNASESRQNSGLAPIAAQSDSDRVSATCPTSRGSASHVKWIPSCIISAVKIRSAFAPFCRKIAQSSPIPVMTPLPWAIPSFRSRAAIPSMIAASLKLTL